MAKVKKSYVLRIDKEILDAVEKWAEDEFRSLNGHLEWISNREIKKNGRMPTQAKKDNDKET